MLHYKNIYTLKNYIDCFEKHSTVADNSPVIFFSFFSIYNIFYHFAFNAPTSGKIPIDVKSMSFFSVKLTRFTRLFTCHIIARNRSKFSVIRSERISQSSNSREIPPGIRHYYYYCFNGLFTKSKKSIDAEKIKIKRHFMLGEECIMLFCYLIIVH